MIKVQRKYKITVTKHYVRQTLHILKNVCSEHQTKFPTFNTINEHTMTWQKLASIVIKKDQLMNNVFLLNNLHNIYFHLPGVVRRTHRLYSHSTFLRWILVQVLHQFDHRPPPWLASVESAHRAGDHKLSTALRRKTFHCGLGKGSMVESNIRFGQHLVHFVCCCDDNF